jgi:hypothetical protein
MNAPWYWKIFTGVLSVGYLSLVSLFLMFSSCARDALIRKNKVDSEFDRIIRDIHRNSKYLSTLKNKRLGLSGYFYVIDYEGRIIYHPKEALIGMNFKDNPFVRRLLKKQSGCIEQHIEGRNRVIVFRVIDAYRILCLSIASFEIDLHNIECEDFD